jgi:glycosyltransferase involved in cell wall biosynthesis
MALHRPQRFGQSLTLMFKVARHSEQGLFKHFAYLAEACVLLRWLAEAEINHLHVHFGTNSATVGMLCRTLGGPPYSFTVHGPEEFDLVKVIDLPEKINRAIFVVAISSYGRSQLYRWVNRDQWNKIHVIHSQFLNHPATDLPEQPQFVCVGRLDEQKGQLLLIDAVKQLASEGLKFKVILVGDGSLRPQIESLIRHYHLESYIETPGWASTTAVKQYLLKSQVMVLPSFAEGLPVVIMEALALQRPVISTYVAGIPELVEPGVCGWLVPPGSVEALTAAMRSALQTPLARLEEMGHIGAERVKSQHDISVEIGKLVGLFRATVGQPQADASLSLDPKAAELSTSRLLGAVNVQR